MDCVSCPRTGPDNAFSVQDSWASCTTHVDPSGGWETPVDWRRMKSVYGDEFGYVVADSTCGQGLAPYSPWCYRSDFAFFDMDKNVDEVYKRAVAVLNKGHSFSYVSHQWTADRTKYLEQCRALARKLKENGVPMTTYAHIAEASARSCQNR